VVARLEVSAALRHAAGGIAGPAPEGEDGAVDLPLGARHLARDVLDLLVVGEEERILGGGRLRSPADPLVESFPDPSHSRLSRCPRGDRLEIDQLGYTLAMPGGVAERELGALGTLEVQVQVVLPGEADAAVELYARAGDAAIGVRDIGLGHAHGERALGHAFVHGPRRIVGD